MTAILDFAILSKRPLAQMSTSVNFHPHGSLNANQVKNPLSNRLQTGPFYRSRAKDFTFDYQAWGSSCSSSLPEHALPRRFGQPVAEAAAPSVVPKKPSSFGVINDQHERYFKFLIYPINWYNVYVPKKTTTKVVNLKFMSSQ